MAVTASIVVEFGSVSAEEEIVAVAEIDTSQNGPNNGKTSFLPGDTVFIDVFLSDNAKITGAIASAGTLTKTGTGIKNLSEFVQFQNENTATVSKPILTVTSNSWFGNDLGNLAKSGFTTLRASSSGVGVVKVDYTSSYVRYALNSPSSLNGETNFTILVVFTADKI